MDTVLEVWEKNENTCINGLEWNLTSIYFSFSFLDINECEDLTLCMNGGFCMNTQGSYQCQCAPGWTGANCEVGKCRL